MKIMKKKAAVKEMAKRNGENEIMNSNEKKIMKKKKKIEKRALK